MNPRLVPPLLLAAAATAATATAAPPRHQQDARQRMPQARAIAAQSPADAIIARLTTRDGHRFEFVNAGGSVGVAEISPNGAPSKLVDAIELQEASPLELYYALTGKGARAPTDLHIAHERFARERGRSDAALKSIALASVPGTKSTVTTGNANCTYNASLTPGQSVYTQDWYLQLGYFKDFTAQQTYDNASVNGTTGKYWYAGTTGERWLGACNGASNYSHPFIGFTAQYRDSNGIWRSQYYATISNGTSLRYYSFGGSTAWRVRLSEAGNDPNLDVHRDYAVAVAGNAPLVRSP